MNNPNLPAATTELIRGVLALIGTARDDPQYRDNARGVLDLCKVALDAAVAAPDEVRVAAARPVAPTTGPGNLGLRIAELAAAGMGVRKIARQLGVHPSTVSRRLRRARAEDVARNA